ncbi:MAG: tRNA pseudouridine(38-40) synthase TruA [Candidatus Omnitrophica bacterium]|nr:tRNA pseudouridine(38-40) synthase TruA [Candidatus Omnitrophota bacterium]
MRNIKLVLEYDGSRFFGFQRQPRRRTVQEILENALTRFFDRKTKISAASSRTDTGVHADYQVVNFLTPSPRSIGQIQKGLNALLPVDVAVKEVAEVPADFHSRYQVRSKIYEYRVWNHPVRSPLHAHQACHIPYRLSLSRMRQGAKLLTGRHDFSSFCAAHGSAKDRVRNIKSFRIIKRGFLILFQIEAEGFLYHMARNLVGALIELGRGRLTVNQLQVILKKRDRRSAPSTAPACGLTLLSVSY